MTEIVTLPRRTVRPCFAFLLPALFAGLALLGALWPGHGWQLFGIGALPGVWTAFLLGSVVGSFGAGAEAWLWIVPTLLGGMPILWLFGHSLDRVEADLRLWFVAAFAVALLAGYVLLQEFADLEGAVEHHGSFVAFVVCSLQLGSYGATLLLLAFGRDRAARSTRWIA